MVTAFEIFAFEIFAFETAFASGLGKYCIQEGLASELLNTKL